MKKILLISVCSVVLLGSVARALPFEKPVLVKTGMHRLATMLPSYNEALDKALKVHNLMTEIPALQVIEAQRSKIVSTEKGIKQMYDSLMKCNEQRFGRFKNAKEVLAKVRGEYEKQRAGVVADSGIDENSLVPAYIMFQSKLYSRKKAIEKEVLVDALTNGKKWGGKSVDKNPRQDVSETIEKDIVGTGLEELVVAEERLSDVKLASTNFNNAFDRAQQEFVEKLNSVGVSVPNFDASKEASVREVYKALKDLKKQHMTEAAEYIEKLDEQDRAHPRTAAARVARSKNKRAVMGSVQDGFPEAFAGMNQFDQSSPQERQRMVLRALEKDTEGKIFLTETNALEVDQKIKEAESTENLLKRVGEFSNDIQKEFERVDQGDVEFDFSRCSG